MNYPKIPEVEEDGNLGLESLPPDLMEGGLGRMAGSGI